MDLGKMAEGLVRFKETKDGLTNQRQAVLDLLAEYDNVLGFSKAETKLGRAKALLKKHMPTLLKFGAAAGTGGAAGWVATAMEWLPRLVG